MLLSLLPDGNEVSENARNRVAAYGNAIKSANIRCVHFVTASVSKVIR